MSTITTAPVLPDTRTSPKHQQGSYRLTDGTVRVIYAQRVLGHVRLTDEPEQRGDGARAYLIERCVDVGPVDDGTSAVAHMNALVADYLQEAHRLQRCPLERAARMLAPRASKDSPFEVMLKYDASTWPEAIKARAKARRQAKAVTA